MEEISEIKDNYGNSIRIMNTQAGLNSFSIIYLNLITEKTPRVIGYINNILQCLHISREYKKHLMKTINSYGFNYCLLSELNSYDYIHLEDEDNKWLIPKQFILDNGDFLHFLKQGFEKQIFISLSKIEQFKLNY